MAGVKILLWFPVAFFAIAETLHQPKIELYEIRDQSATRSSNRQPVLKRINQLDSRSDVATFVKHIFKHFAWLNNPETSSKYSESESEGEGGFIDKTRSSLIVVPNDKEISYDMVRLTKKADGKPELYRLFQAQSNDDNSYGKRIKRKIFEPQWEIPMNPPDRRT